MAAIMIIIIGWIKQIQSEWRRKAKKAKMTMASRRKGISVEMMTAW